MHAVFSSRAFGRVWLRAFAGFKIPRQTQNTGDHSPFSVSYFVFTAADHAFGSPQTNGFWEPHWRDCFAGRNDGWFAVFGDFCIRAAASIMVWPRERRQVSVSTLRYFKLGVAAGINQLPVSF